MSYEVLQQKHGVQFKRLPDDVIEAFLKVSLEVIRETAEKDPHAMRIHENFMEFRRRATNIAPTVELGYLGARST